MFGHLDDPSPPSPDEATRRLVAQRAARRRERRRRRVLAVSLAAVVVLIGAAAVISRATATTPSPPQHETAYQFNRHRHLAARAPVPTTALEDVVFVNAQRGFGLADHRGHLVLAASTDGGARWVTVNGRLPVSYFGATPAQMEFTDVHHGYLWGGAGSGSGPAPLWTTANGGTTWHRAAISGTVFDVSAIGANVWALSAPCPGKAFSSCPLEVDVSLDAGASWTAAPSTVPRPVAAVGMPSTVELARITPSGAYVLSSGNLASFTSVGVFAYTSDGGATWSTRSVPCGAQFLFGTELAASSTDDLWLICGGQGSAGNQLKQLYRSTDGGVTWRLAAESPVPPSSGLPPVPAGVGTLRELGYVAPYALAHKQLAVLSAAQAWLQPGRADVMVTHDGGTTWSPVRSLLAAGFGTGAPGNLTFLSATRGWVCELGVGLWHTVDGVHWRPLGD